MEKAGFAFFGGAVLAEELGAGAGQHRSAEAPGLPNSAYSAF
jgi:hypothetical protein